MKEPPNLFAVEGIVRVVEIEHDFVGVGGEKADRQIQQRFLYRGKIGVNLMILGLTLGAHFDAVERGRTGQSLVAVV